MEVIPEVWGKESGRGPHSRAFGQMSEKRRYTVQGEKWNPAKQREAQTERRWLGGQDVDLFNVCTKKDSAPKIILHLASVSFQAKNKHENTPYQLTI